MSLTITDTKISSDLTPVQARYSEHAAADGLGAWIVDGRFGRLFTREQAITEVQLAEMERDL